MPAFVELARVSKRYQVGDQSVLTAADDVSLELERGSSTALVGPSGSGKSTLLHLLGAIDSPDEGRIVVDGSELTALGRRALANYRAGVGFVFQRFHLLSALTVSDNVGAPLVGRTGERERRARAAEMLKAVGLADRAAARPDQLSGGQQQRVAIARALVVQPVLLLADEPTGNLDSTTADEILTLLREMRERFGTTLVMATHDQGVAARCDRIIKVQDGRVDSLARTDASDEMAADS